MKLDAFRLDTQAIEEGTWRDAEGLAGKGIRWKVRGIGNLEYRKLEQKLVADMPREQRLAGLSLEQQDALIGELLFRTVLLDWQGFETDAGEALAYSPDVAKAICTDPAYRILRQSIDATATKLANETALDREDAAKN